MGIWRTNWNVSYAGKSSEYTSKEIITYTNTGDSTEYIESISLPMGTGLGTYTAGDAVTGDGSPITFYVYVDGDSGKSSTPIRINNTVGVASGDTGTYPDQDDMVKYTITFRFSIAVNPQETVCFTYASNVDQTSSQVLVWDIDNVSGIVVSSSVYRFNGNVWEKVLVPKVYKNGTWKSLYNISKISGSGWSE